MGVIKKSAIITVISFVVFGLAIGFYADLDTVIFMTKPEGGYTKIGELCLPLYYINNDASTV